MEISPVIRPVTHCDKELQFTHFSEWPQALPGIAINRSLIIGFDRDWVLDYAIDSESLEFSDTWVSVFSTAHASLSWIELLFLTRVLKNFESLPLEKVWKHFGYKDASSFDELSGMVLALPESVLRWLSDKKVGPQEMMPLRSINTEAQLNDVNQFWPQLQKLQMSRQEGMKMLEIWTELILLGVAVKDIEAQPIENATEWIARLRALRFPETAKQDQSAKSWVDAQSWPRPTQIRWLRQGDQTGLEIKVIVKKPGDFSSSKKALDEIEALLTLAPGELWH